MNRIEHATKQVKNWNAEELRLAGLIPTDGAYFPSIYYPPIPMHGPSDEATVFKDLAYDPAAASSVYVHIPFCRSRCRYCHWVVNTSTPEKQIDEYLDNLAREMELWRQKLGVKKLRPHSILIGGGTPTAISPRQTARLLEALNANIDLPACAQTTVETEPGSILGDDGLTKLKIMKDNGVQRVSLGVQSFDPKALVEMGRAHSADDAKRAIEQIRKVRFASLSIDLIYGHPGCTVENWAKTLDTAVELGVDAFQLYRLRIVPHGDRVGAVKPRFEKTPEVFPSVTDVYVMKQLGFDVAGNQGLSEVSRRLFAKGEPHASQYLKDHCDRLIDVIGFGISSWSNLQGRFYLNTGESLEKYAALIQAGKLPINRGMVRSADDEQRRAIILALKHNGVSKRLFKELTGKEVGDVFPRKLATLKRFGLIEETEKAFCLTPRGTFFADEVVIQFYHSKYIPFPKSSYATGDLNPYNE